MALAPIARSLMLYEGGVNAAPAARLTVPPSDAPTLPPAVTLNPLSLSEELESGTPVDGTIIGATAGSTIQSLTPGLTVDSGALTFSFDGSASAGKAILRETLLGAKNTPRETEITIVAGPDNPPAPTINNTDETSTLDEGAVAGAAAAFAEVESLIGDLQAQLETNAAALAALEN